ncbi:MAG TPA: hypothetical protein VKZ53_01965 [Candidatus Angelobacter sp.]|nr:hypothetical protein [Candidatus Angelobacter sp.]
MKRDTAGEKQDKLSLMRWRVLHLLLGTAILLLLVSSLSAGGKRKRPMSLVRPDQTADLQIPKLVTSTQNCENWALAAGLETMLAKQDVALNQQFWGIRIGGGRCLPELPPMDDITEAVNREFVLDDGRHMRLELRYQHGVPTEVDSLILRIKDQNPSMVIWRGHLYYITGVTYDEYDTSNGGRHYEVKEIRLANTLAGQPGGAFERERDDPAEIEGILTIVATPL